MIFLSQFYKLGALNEASAAKRFKSAIDSHLRSFKRPTSAVGEKNRSNLMEKG